MNRFLIISYNSCGESKKGNICGSVNSTALTQRRQYHVACINISRHAAIFRTRYQTQRKQWNLGTDATHRHMMRAVQSMRVEE